MIDRIQKSIDVARRNGSKIALMYMDLDKFKSINDSLGHTVGDELLKEVSRRLRESIRPQDTVARFGGDEFTLLLTGITELGDVIQMAERVLEKIQQPIHIQQQELLYRKSTRLNSSHVRISYAVFCLKKKKIR